MTRPHRLTLAAFMAAALMAAPPGEATTQARTPAATPNPSGGVCEVFTSGAVSPLVVTARSEVTIELGLAAQCPDGSGGRADVYLLLDRSTSMGEDGKLEAAHAAVRNFVSNVDFTRNRVGLIPFTSNAFVMQTLTNKPELVLDALALSGGPAQGTDIAEAIEVADQEFEISARPGAVRVMILLTDGQSNEEAMTVAAQSARARGTVIFAVGLGPDADQSALRRVASSSEHIAYAPGPRELAAIYDRIAAMIQDFSVTDVRVYAELASGVGYVPGSGDPEAPAGVRTLDWWLPVVGAKPTDIKFRARMSLVGHYRPAVAVWAEYLDGDDVRRRVVFAPLPEVEVLPPLMSRVYLPTAIQRDCLARASGADVVLAVDTSESMRGPLLADAVAGAKSFIGLMNPAVDQVAVVGYDNQGRVAQGLTSNLPLAAAALDNLTSSPGTRIDRGLEVAAGLVLGPARRPGSQAVVVILSDGQQVEHPGRAIAVAELATGAGIAIYAIGLGADADLDLLRAVTRVPERVFVAPSSANLLEIYHRVGGAVRCRTAR